MGYAFSVRSFEMTYKENIAIRLQGNCMTFILVISTFSCTSKLVYIKLLENTILRKI